LSEERQQEREKETSDKFAKQMNAEKMYMFRMKSKTVTSKSKKSKKIEPEQEASTT